MKTRPAPIRPIADLPPAPRPGATVLWLARLLDPEGVAAVAAAACPPDPDGNSAGVIVEMAADVAGRDPAPWLTAAERARYPAHLRGVVEVRTGPWEEFANRRLGEARPTTAPSGEVAAWRAVAEATAGPSLPGRETDALCERIRAGRATPTPGEPPPALPGVAERIVPIERLAEQARAADERGERVVTVNGCFDLLHPGHLRFLADAAALGERLAVLVNSDVSVRAYKGDNRPFLDEGARATVLAALAAVDWVTVFEGDDPLDVLETVRPRVHVKGGTYEPDRVRAERELVESGGGELRMLPMVGGYSTTDLAARIRASR